MPLVSTTMRSKPAIRYRLITSFSAALIALSDARVAILRINTRSVSILFIRIRSPNRAPPVFTRDGSTDTIPIVFCGNSDKKRLTNSSVNELFPAPPVPVIPITGIMASDLDAMACVIWSTCLPLFSRLLIHRDKVAGSRCDILLKLILSTSKGSKSQCSKM